MLVGGTGVRVGVDVGVGVAAATPPQRPASLALAEALPRMGVEVPLMTKYHSSCMFCA